VGAVDRAVCLSVGAVDRAVCLSVGAGGM
jgi:hypothetical protein